MLELLSKIGYRPLDVGPLSAARYLEAMQFLNISLSAANGWPWQSSLEARRTYRLTPAVRTGRLTNA